MKPTISRQQVAATLKLRGFALVHEGTPSKAESFRHDATGEQVYLKSGDHDPLVIDPRHESQAAALSNLQGVSKGGNQYTHSTAYGRFPLRQHTGYKPVNYGLDFSFVSTSALNGFLDVLLMSGIPEPDAEALRFVASFLDPRNPQLDHWRPKYGATIATIKDALARNALESLFELIWRTQDNSVSNAGQGVLGFEIADRLRDRLIGVIEEVAADGSPANFESIIERFEIWRSAGEIVSVPRLVISRAFAAIHPERYHTTVDSSKQERIIPWFVRHTRFVPPGGGWAEKAEALTAHLSSWDEFGGDILLRNMFPWFVFGQMRNGNGVLPFRAGHTSRPAVGQRQSSVEVRSIDYRHNVIQDRLFALLGERYGNDSVATEHPTGTGGRADALVHLADGRYELYEIKPAITAADAVRQAMGQLLEYAYRHGGLEPAVLHVVSDAPLDETTSAYLSRLKSEFSLPVEYLRIAIEPEGEA